MRKSCMTQKKVKLFCARASQKGENVGLAEFNKKTRHRGRNFFYLATKCGCWFFELFKVKFTQNFSHLTDYFNNGLDGRSRLRMISCFLFTLSTLFSRDSSCKWNISEVSLGHIWASYWQTFTDRKYFKTGSSIDVPCAWATLMCVFECLLMVWVHAEMFWKSNLQDFSETKSISIFVNNHALCAI